MGNIYSQYLLKPKSALGYMADMDEAEMRGLQMDTQRRQNALAEMAFGMKRDEASRAEQDRNLLSTLAGQAGGDQNKLVALLRASGSMPLMQQADTLEKSALERDKTKAETGKVKADTAKSDAETLSKHIDALKFLASSVYANPTPQTASLALDMWERLTGRQATEDRQRLAQATTPEQIMQWAQGHAMTADQMLQRRQAQAEAEQKARNDMIGPDGKPNMPLISAKQSVARAGASNVSINTGQKGFDNEIKLRGEFKQEPVYKAHQEMQSAYGQIRQALKQASPAGDLAGATKIMKLLDPGSVVRESELGMAMAASGLLDRATNYAGMVMSGQKLTPTQRKDFQRLADALMQESSKAFNTKRSEYEKLGGEYGLNAPRALGPAAADAGGEWTYVGPVKGSK